MMRHDSLQKDIIIGMVPDTPDRGRLRRTRLEDIKKWTGLHTVEAYMPSQDRTEWKTVVSANAYIVNGWKKHDGQGV